MLANQHDVETQHCQLTALHHMANEKGNRERRGNPNPLQSQSFLTQCSASAASDSASCPHVGHGLNSTLEAPREGLRQGYVGGGGWREAEPPASKPKCSAPAMQRDAPKIILLGRIPREIQRVVPIKNYKTFRASQRI